MSRPHYTDTTLCHNVDTMRQPNIAIRSLRSQPFCTFTAIFPNSGRMLSDPTHSCICGDITTVTCLHACTDSHTAEPVDD